MKSFLSFCGMILCCALLPAQEISFKNDVYQFGDLREEGKAYGSFTLTNTGDAPLIIRRVSASCGCTTPDYPKTPIAPGDTAEITVAYNTEGRPGNFNKTITVYSNALSQPTYTLTIRGTVEGRNNTAASLYPKEIGPLRLRSNQLFLGEVVLGSVRTETIPVFNQNEDTPVKISFQSVPKHVRVSVSNSLIPADETAIVTVNYLSENVKDYGRREDFFYITAESVGGQKFSGKVRISCHLKEDFSKKKNAAKKPVAAYASSVIDFGEVAQNALLQQSITLQNTGNETLYIRKIDCPASQLQVKASKESVAPGKSVELKVSLDTSKLRAFVKYYIDVITNDPVHPIHRITVSATIKE